MHIPYSDNKNQALFEENNKTVPLVYFNIVKLNKGESYSFQLSQHESSVVPATGMIELSVDGKVLGQIELENQMYGTVSLRGAIFLLIQSALLNAFLIIQSVSLQEAFMKKNLNHF